MVTSQKYLCLYRFSIWSRHQIFAPGKKSAKTMSKTKEEKRKHKEKKEKRAKDEKHSHKHKHKHKEKKSSKRERELSPERTPPSETINEDDYFRKNEEFRV